MFGSIFSFALSLISLIFIDKCWWLGIIGLIISLINLCLDHTYDENDPNKIGNKVFSIASAIIGGISILLFVLGSGEFIK